MTESDSEPTLTHEDIEKILNALAAPPAYSLRQLLREAKESTPLSETLGEIFTKLLFKTERGPMSNLDRKLARLLERKFSRLLDLRVPPATSGTDTIQSGTEGTAPTDFSDPNNETTIVASPTGGKRIQTVKATDGHVFYPLTEPASITNVEFRMEFETSDNVGWQYGIGVRYLSPSGGTTYLLRTNGTALELVKVTNGVYSAALATFALNFVANTRYYIQLYALGTAIKAVAWKKSEAQPAAFQMEVTDTSITGAGQLTGYAHKAGTKYIYSYAWRNLDTAATMPDTVSPAIPTNFAVAYAA